ncbi:hypothetical protein MMC26_006917 [Xylographa opegraphella]|nr:hypothetical protein [Xylographa opegraphella]
MSTCDGRTAPFALKPRTYNPSGKLKHAVNTFVHITAPGLKNQQQSEYRLLNLGYETLAPKKRRKTYIAREYKAHAVSQAFSRGYSKFPFPFLVLCTSCAEHEIKMWGEAPGNTAARPKHARGGSREDIATLRPGFISATESQEGF